MAVLTQNQRQNQPAPFVWRPPKSDKPRRRQPSLVVPGFKAGRAGGLGLAILLLIGLIPPPDYSPFISLAILVVPGYFVTCLATGLLGGVLAGDSLKNDQQSTQVGWNAGFWAGIFSAIAAMILAANEMLMVNMGQGVVSQFTPEQLVAWSPYLTPAAIALTGRVLGALVVYGLIGSLISALIGAIGGMLYFKLSKG
jgi:hypothetical protein